MREAGAVQGITLLLPAGLSIMAIVVLVPVLPLLMAHFHALPGAEYRVPMLLTIPAACLVVASPIAGWIADRWDRRRVLMAAMAIYAAVGMLPLALDAYWAIFASRVALGCVEAVVLTISTALVGDFFTGAARDRWLGYQIGVASIFATVLIWVGGALAQFGWRGPFAVYASALVMLAAVACFTWEPPRAARQAAADLAGFPWARMGGLCALTLLGSMLFYFVLIQLPIMFAGAGLLPSARSGFWLAVVGLGISAGTVIFGQLARLAPARLLATAFTVLAIGFAGMRGAPSLGWLIGAALCNQIGAGLLMPTLLTWTTRQLPAQYRGRGIGLWQGTFSLGQFLMPIVVTYIGGFAGGLPGAMLVFAGFAGVAALGFAAVCAAAGRAPHISGTTIDAG